MRAPASRLIVRDLANSSPNDFDALAVPSSLGRLTSTNLSIPAINRSDGRKPIAWSRSPPQPRSPHLAGEAHSAEAEASGLPVEVGLCGT
jgi:hypothetical protein